MNGDRLVALATTALSMESRQLIGIASRKAEARMAPYLSDGYVGELESGQYLTDIEIDPIRENGNFIGSSVTADDREYFENQIDEFLNGRVTFLNRTAKINPDEQQPIDPEIGLRKGFPRLWTLKLLSYEPASWTIFSEQGDTLEVIERLVRWLESWQTSEITSIGSENHLRRYWTPYAVSRRIDNLARMLAVQEEISSSSASVLSNHLAKNTAFLTDHVEYDVGGNHLIENGCALIIGGVVLNKKEIIKQGIDILETELPRQLTVEGMHFELSPMYHTILLFRLLSAIDILQRSGRSIPDRVLSLVTAMDDALRAIAPNDANYPLLNDSVYREGPSRPSCLRLSNQVLDHSPNADECELDGTSGYYTVSSDNLQVLLDGGKPGPSHLPAHAHNDIGNIVLWHSAIPIVTDTGVFDYSPGERREHSRSVSAHNTIQVGDLDQATTSGRFLMGPRPDPKSEYFESGSEQGARVRYQAPRFTFRRLYKHERAVFSTEDGIRLQDSVSRAMDRICSRFHLHPSCAAEVDGNTVLINADDQRGVQVTIETVDDIQINQSEYYPEYGVAIQRPVVEATVHDPNTQTVIQYDIYEKEEAV